MKVILKRLVGYSVLFILFGIFVIIPTLAILGFTGGFLDKVVAKIVDARDNPPPLLR